ncbi:replication initiator [Demequina sp. SO4-13]|uniref:replication initiator n=1 Tax=Demequina sp. SO4-13 TaxID=3401027 RepID=UPI003AF481E7
MGRAGNSRGPRLRTGRQRAGASVSAATCVCCTSRRRTAWLALGFDVQPGASHRSLARPRKQDDQRGPYLSSLIANQNHESVGAWEIAAEGARLSPEPADQIAEDEVPEPVLDRSRCSRPITTRRSADDEFVAVACGSRSDERCTHCANVYFRDTMEIAAAGIDAADDESQFFWITATGPSYGPLHEVPQAMHGSALCACGVEHCEERDRDLVGVPLAEDEYDYAGQALFNGHVRALVKSVRRSLKRDESAFAMLHVLDLQARGALHLHALLRCPGDSGLTAETIESAFARRGIKTREGTAIAFADVVVHDLVSEAQGPGEILDPPELAATVRQSARNTAAYMAGALRRLTPDRRGRASSHWSRLGEAANTSPCSDCEPTTGHCAGYHHTHWGVPRQVSGKTDGWSVGGLTRKRLHEQRREFAARAAQGSEPAPCRTWRSLFNSTVRELPSAMTVDPFAHEQLTNRSELSARRGQTVESSVRRGRRDRGFSEARWHRLRESGRFRSDRPP